MVELKSGSNELKELLSGNDAAENDDVDEEFEINVYGQRKHYSIQPVLWADNEFEVCFH